MHSIQPRISVLSAVAAAAIATCAASAHVTLNSPNGGEVLTGGSTFTISWEIRIAHQLQNWDLWYSTQSNSGDWTPIQINFAAGSAQVGSVHSFDWIVPEIDASDVWVRVRMDNSGTDYYDVSASSFAIVPAPGTVGVMALASLMGVSSRRRRNPSAV